MIAPQKMAALYAGLTLPERLRLYASLVRSCDLPELTRLRESTPSDHAAAWNHCACIVRGMSRLPPTLTALQFAAQRDEEALAAATASVYQDRLRWLSLWDIWKLVAYPVTEREYQTIIALERERLEPLAAFAQYLADSGPAEDAQARQWHPAVVTWLAGSQAESDDAAAAEALALLETMRQRGDLPEPVTSPDGPALPWGILADWLEPERQDYTPYGPDYHVPCVQVLGGLMARWEIRPESEHDQVWARREQICATVATIAQLPPADLPRI